MRESLASPRDALRDTRRGASCRGAPAEQTFPQRRAWKTCRFTTKPARAGSKQASSTSWRTPRGKRISAPIGKSQTGRGPAHFAKESVTVSTRGKGNCRDNNAVAESFFATLKALTSRRNWNTRAERATPPAESPTNRVARNLPGNRNALRAALRDRERPIPAAFRAFTRAWPWSTTSRRRPCLRRC